MLQVFLFALVCNLWHIESLLRTDSKQDQDDSKQDPDDSLVIQPVLLLLYNLP